MVVIHGEGPKGRACNAVNSISKGYQNESQRFHAIVYITQLIGLCLGISAKKLGFEKLMIPASDVIKHVESVA